MTIPLDLQWGSGGSQNHFDQLHAHTAFTIEECLEWGRLCDYGSAGKRQNWLNRMRDRVIKRREPKETNSA